MDNEEVIFQGINVDERLIDETLPKGGWCSVWIMFQETEHWEEGEHRSRGEGSWERDGMPLGMWGSLSSGLQYYCWVTVLIGCLVHRLATYWPLVPKLSWRLGISLSPVSHGTPWASVSVGSLPAPHCSDISLSHSH